MLWLGWFLQLGFLVSGLDFGAGVMPERYNEDVCFTGKKTEALLEVIVASIVVCRTYLQCGNVPKEFTLPETNIAPKKQWLEDEFPFGMAYFQGLC